MARVQLNLPSQYLFSMEMRVRYGDLNTANHVGNDQIFSLVNEARNNFFEFLELDSTDMDGCSILVGDVAAIYKAEGFEKNVLLFEVTVGDFNKYGCDLLTKITNLTRGKVQTEIKTGIVFFDNQEQKISPVPNAFMQAIEKARASLL